MPALVFLENLLGFLLEILLDSFLVLVTFIDRVIQLQSVAILQFLQYIW